MHSVERAVETSTGFGQLPDIIYFGESVFSLFTLPLAPWLSTRSEPVVFDPRTPTCKRGYVGKWSVEDDKLWLIGLYAWRDGKNTGVPELFDGKREVVADWYTGPLVVEPSASSIRGGEYPKPKALVVTEGRVSEA